MIDKVYNKKLTIGDHLVNLLMIIGIICGIILENSIYVWLVISLLFILVLFKYRRTIFEKSNRICLHKMIVFDKDNKMYIVYTKAGIILLPFLLAVLFLYLFNEYLPLFYFAYGFIILFILAEYLNVLIYNKYLKDISIIENNIKNKNKYITPVLNISYIKDGIYSIETFMYKDNRALIKEYVISNEYNDYNELISKLNMISQK